MSGRFPHTLLTKLDFTCDFRALSGQQWSRSCAHDVSAKIFMCDANQRFLVTTDAVVLEAISLDQPTYGFG